MCVHTSHTSHKQTREPISKPPFWYLFQNVNAVCMCTCTDIYTYIYTHRTHETDAPCTGVHTHMQSRQACTRGEMVLPRGKFSSEHKQHLAHTSDSFTCTAQTERGWNCATPNLLEVHFLCSPLTDTCLLLPSFSRNITHTQS